MKLFILTGYFDKRNMPALITEMDFVVRFKYGRSYLMSTV